MPFLPDKKRNLLWWPLRLAAVQILALLVNASLIPVRDWPNTHEARRYHFLTAMFHDAVVHGCWYPRWLPDLDGGYGYPTFVFYQPAFFCVSSAWMRFFDSPAAANYATVLTFTCLGAIGAFLLARQLADEWCAWFCTVLFLLTPYFYCNLLVRGDLSELAAMLLFPWLLYFAVRVVQNIDSSRPAPLASAGLGASMATIVYCHAMTALFAGIVLAVVAVGLAIQRVPLRPLIAAIVQAGLVAAALSIFYALPLVQMRAHVDFRAAISGYFTTSDHAVYPLQYFQSQWGFGRSEPRSPDDGMSFQLGLPHFAIALAGLIAARRNRVYRAVLASYVIILIFATHWFGPLWDFPPLSYLQFPWRILAVTAGLQIFLASGIHKWLPDKPPVKVLTYLSLIALAVYWCQPQFYPSEQRNEDVDAWVRQQRSRLLAESITFAGADEFRPRTAQGLKDAPPRGTTPLVVARGERHIAPAADSTAYRIVYEIDQGPPAELVINQAYFPGWRVELAAKLIPPAVLEKQLTADGRMTVHVASTAPQSLVAYYAGPPGGSTRLILFVVLIGAYAAWAGYQWRTMPRAASDPSGAGRLGEPPPEKQTKRDRKRRQTKAGDDAA